MVGLPAIAVYMESSPGRVFTAPGTKATSAQSGEAPAGRSAGATSVTSPPNISSGASTVPSTLMPLPYAHRATVIPSESALADDRGSAFRFEWEPAPKSIC